MAFYSLTLLEIARILADEDDAWTDIEVKFIEHFVLIVDAMHSQGLWDEEDGFFYDVFHAADGTTVPIKVRSIVGVLPLLGMVVLGPDLLSTLGTLRKRFAGFLGQDDRARRGRHGRVVPVPGTDAVAVGVIPPREVRRVLARVFDEGEFLSPHGLRALSKYHEEHPLWVDLAGVAGLGRLRAGRVAHRHVRRQLQLARAGVDAGQLPRAAQPPALRPVARRRRRRSSTPPGAATAVALALCADDLRQRLISLFLRGLTAADRATAGSTKLQDDPRWRDNIAFSEYFHGDNGAGLGASHQTGWTGLVADLICRPDPFAGDRPWEL